jgi:hypothetical protein
MQEAVVVNKSVKHKPEETSYTVGRKKSDNSKSGENWRRKANGSTVTKVTMIARPPKIINL